MVRYNGEYIEHIRPGKVEFSYYTFTPRPLMDGNFFKIDKELSNLLISTHHTLGVLEGMLKYALNRESFMELSLLMESCCSRLIDYERPSLYETLIDGEYSSYATLIASAYKYSMDKEINVSVLLDICKTALHGVNTDNSVALREKQTYLSNIRSNYVEYNPTAPEHIIPAMMDIMDYLCNNTSDDILIRAALIHYQFETIHPFERYNGIVGRILNSMILRSICSETAYAMCLSEFFYNNRGKYIDRISSAQDNGRYLRFIKFFINGVNYAANQAVNRFDKYEQIIAGDEMVIKSNKFSTPNTLNVYNYFKRHLVSRTLPISNELGISFNTASKIVQELVEMGVLRFRKQQSRNRIFIYQKVFEMFESE